MSTAVIRPDPAAGLASERTVLAWRRTAVAAMANVALLLRNALEADDRAALIAPVLGVVALLTLAGTAIRRGYELRAHHHRHIRDSRRSVLAVSAAVAVVGLAALVMVASLV